MSGRNWTDDQKAAIYTKYKSDGESCNLLVNAAAGSGKTAVLVERIIEKLIPRESNPAPTDVNRLLVVTFTNAAAAEMKERIADALEKKAEEAEENNDRILYDILKRQISLLYDADITTIDAFCLKMIRENFHLLGIDPNFGIADNAQLALLADEAMEELFEECYEQKDEAFLKLADMFSDGRDDRGLREIIYEVYNFINAMPSPMKWLDEKVNMYLLEDGIEKSPWIIKAFERKNAVCAEAIKLLENAIEYMIANSDVTEITADKAIEMYPPGKDNPLEYEWQGFYEIIAAEYMAAKAALCADWNGTYDIFNTLEFKRWAKNGSFKIKEKTAADDKELSGFVKDFRDEAKKKLSVAIGIIDRKTEEIEGQLRDLVYPQAVAIAEIVKKYAKKYAEKKTEKNVLEFSDIEHLCLKLFEENEEVCSFLKEKYEEILMDEYQDSNGLQEEIFNKISRGNNMFMVGDMKQSIYLFRRSDPMIFKEKSDTFKIEEDSDNRKITLSKNFRSRKEVLDSVNAVFKRVMSERVGDIEYNDEHWLNNGNTTYEEKNIGICGGYKSECYLLDPDYEIEDENSDEEPVDYVEFEAKVIAAKIAELKKSGYMVRDGNDYRPIRNSDITILMSSYKYVSEIYISALNSEGIDCFADSKGYFDKNEVKLILALIKIIQNPYQDIPMLGILRSPVGSFSDDELVIIRKNSEGLIYDALKQCAESEEELAEKCRKFIERLKRWREYAKHMSCAKLIWTLYEETGIYAFVGALYGGEEAQANLRLLFERAQQYENSGFKGLFNFIRYIGKLETREEEMSSAKLVGEGNDVVRIMTIHKSKGLEFPVVFLAGCGKQFKRIDAKVPIHKSFGLGLNEINTEMSYTVPTVAKASVSSQLRNESISEEERKLYVAMTRAKEKLIVTGTRGKKAGSLTEDKMDRILPDENAVMNPEDAVNAKSFMDWIAPVARQVKDLWTYEIVSDVEQISLVDAEAEEKKTESKKEDFDLFIYPYDNLSRVPTKISVTELKLSGSNLSVFSNDSEPENMPEFMRLEKDLTSAQKGTAIHTVMQKTEPVEDMDEMYVKNLIEDLVQKGELSHDEASAVETDKIITFYKSDLGKRIIKSKNAVREAPFETEIPLSYFDEYKNSEEKILLQGIIDCYFEEEDGIVLVDYKSDFYRNPEEIKKKYQSQLEWYGYAIEKITKKKVKEKYIYMFYGNDIAEC